MQSSEEIVELLNSQLPPTQNAVLEPSDEVKVDPARPRKSDYGQTRRTESENTADVQQKVVEVRFPENKIEDAGRKRKRAALKDDQVT